MIRQLMPLAASTRLGPNRRRIVGALAAILTAAGFLTVTPARADHVDMFDCNADLGDPEPGTHEWETAYYNAVWCRNERSLVIQSNPAYYAAQVSNVAGGGEAGGDPFRDPATRWAGIRGDTLQVTWTDRNGAAHNAVLLSPLDATGPLPGIVLSMWSGASFYWWAAEALAEHGYVVMFGDFTDIPSSVDATDYFVATPENPTSHGEHNPWYARLDPTRLGVVGHSGFGGIAIHVGNIDPRFDAVVSWDPAGPGIEGLTLRTPTMVQVRELFETRTPPSPIPPAAKPEPEPGSRWAYFDAFRAAGVDAMQVAPRAATHVDWLGAGCLNAGSLAFYFGACSLHGEQVVTYYMLAWFDRYLRGAPDPAIADDALRRLTATDTFDESSDVHSIGAGSFDGAKADEADSLEAGNVLITIGGQSIRNRLSLWHPTRYWLDGGALRCEDVRAGCPE